jgi:hypothetical protein
MLFSGRYALQNSVDPVHGIFTAKGIALMAIGLLVLAVFLFLDWRMLLEERKVKVEFRIWR